MNSVSKNNLIFSIIIPVFNTKISYFIRCLESIRNNNLDKNQFEVIIINDGMENFSEYNSTINEYLKESNIQIKVISNPLNLKQGYSRYIGLKASEGEYIHFVDSDDEIFPYTYTK
ncbi:MAG: glycosyltransferase, partial [Methanobrevibacter sp.]|nr:glycosyltransferase [Candidatus Methanovirga meridionalis]